MRRLEELERQVAQQRHLIEQLTRALDARHHAALPAADLDNARGTGRHSDILTVEGTASVRQAASDALAEGPGAGKAESGSASAAPQSDAQHGRHESESAGTGAARAAPVIAAKTNREPAQVAAAGTTPGTPPLITAGTSSGPAQDVTARTSSGPARVVTAGTSSAPPQLVTAGSIPGKAPTAAAGPPATTHPGRAESNSVGQPPPDHKRRPEVAALFEQPGVLTPKGKAVIEPALQFGYSSSNRVALVGYTVIPALLIGLVDVREVKRNTTTAILSARAGLTNRFEIEGRIPYVYRSDATVSREIFTGTAVENVFATSGSHIGDAEFGMRYQLNTSNASRAFYVASLRLKTRTGRDPFSVVTDCARRCVGPNATGTGLPLDLPTGSGFYSIQPGVTWLFASDPAVFFGSVSYLYNLTRKNVSRTVLGGEREFLGDVAAGAIIGMNFGVGLGLNDRTSLSFGYDHSSVGRTRQDGRPLPGSVRTQLGTLLLGMSYRINERRSVNVAVGAGLTRDTPDVSLTVRLPVTF